MKKAILGSVLVAGLAVFSGCGFVFVARSQPYYTYHRTAPAYCYDCHSWSGSVGYSTCSHYEIRVVSGGYYYRPLHHRHHEEFSYAKFRGSDSKEIRSHQDKSNRGRR
jgi:hypothetical protein